MPGATAAAVPAGSLDPEFADAGILRSDLAPGTFSKVAVYESGPEAGKVVVAGTTSFYGRDELVLMRLDPDGALDPSFDQDGLVLDPALSSATALALDPAGDVVVGSGNRVIRFGSDGALDASFGACLCGHAQLPAPLADLAIDTEGADSGEVLYAGTSTTGSPARQVAHAGRLDSQGHLLWQRQFQLGENPDVPDPSWNDAAGAIGVGTDGLVTVAGARSRTSDTPTSQSDRQDGVVRMEPDGSFDSSFGTGGGVAHTLAGSRDTGAAVTDLVVDPSGGVLVNGVSTSVPAHPVQPSSTLLRLTDTGQPDTSFAGDGTASAPPNSQMREVAIDSEHRIVLGGIVDYFETVAVDAGAVRLLPDGSPDHGFGRNGVARLEARSSGKQNDGAAVAVDARGVLVGGALRDDGQGDTHPMVARFLGESISGEPSPDGPGDGSGDEGDGGVAGGAATSFKNVHVHRLVVPKSRSRLAALGVRAEASCDEDCRILVEVEVSDRVARAMGLKGNVLGSGSVLAAAGHSRWVVAKLTAVARRALRAYNGGGRLHVNVTGLSP
jgi:uncharacterized delta-60 repeat protein